MDENKQIVIDELVEENKNEMQNQEEPQIEQANQEEIK